MRSIEDRLLSIECSIDNLVTQLEKTNEYLQIMAREAIVSNVPDGCKAEQRAWIDYETRYMEYNYELAKCKIKLNDEKIKDKGTLLEYKTALEEGMETAREQQKKLEGRGARRV
jgi:hypothetical protein